MTTDDERPEALRQWLTEQAGEPPRALEPASVDASFRRYFRVTTADGSAIAMDAPPEREDPAPFVRVAELVRAAGLHAPAVLARDMERGFLLLEDLGDCTYLDAVRRGDADSDALYHDAIAALVRWQAATRGDALPVYDADTLRRELDLFPDWYVRAHRGREPDAAWRADWDSACAVLIGAMTDQPAVYVHRDFTPRNLMVAEPNPGIIDFQDAVIGPLLYDWVSLVRDAFVSWPAATEARWLDAYRRRAVEAGLAVPSDPRDLQRAVDFTAAQRHLKVIGIFARLWHRDGKPDYLADAPRFFAYLERETRPWPELAPLRRILTALAPAAADGAGAAS